MNLMKYFNKNYGLQNIKKSRSVLAFFLGLVPILSIIIFMISFSNLSSLETVTLESISLIPCFGIFIIPILLSACLFSFVYKRKSVDFINSMPLSRKTIFVTNTIIGIILIIMMIVLNGFGIYLVANFMDITIPFRMIADYIFIWSLAYIFVFILSNIAMSVSGNVITQIIVTLLLLFFIPFIHDYIFNLGGSFGVDSNRSIQFIYDAANDFNYSNYFFYIKSSTNYTLPYNMVHLFFSSFSSFHIYNVVSFIKMFGISIGGFFVGLFLFKRRKMEDNETSFRKLATHNFVKALTMFPMIVFISFLLFRGASLNWLSILLILFILIMYYFIYDLITKKGISLVGKNLIHFCITLVVSFGFCILASHYAPSFLDDTDLELLASDIHSISYTEDSFVFNDYDYLQIKDERVIENIIKILAKTRSTGSFFKEIKLETKKGTFVGTVTFQDEEEFHELVSQSKNTYTSKESLDFKNLYAVTYYDSFSLSISNDSKLLKEVERVVKEGITCSDSHTIDYYIYSNGIVRSASLSSCSSSIIKEFIQESKQEKNQKLTDIIKNMSYTKANNNNFYAYAIISFNNGFSNTRDFLNGSDKEIFNLIKKYSSDKLDIDKGYITIEISYKGVSYYYSTNRVEEFRDMLDKNQESNHDTD